MKKLIKILRWPEDRKKGTMPLFVIAWHVIWLPIIYTGLIITLLGISLSYGKEGAIQFWNDVK